jgi:FKBP-type peptidyl-prolyl cis-trans isomerase SlyD
MVVSHHKVVSMHYTLTNASGEVLDSSRQGQPLAYIQGIGNIISGLEEALDGKKVGDKVNANIPPEKGYGLRDENLVFKVNKNEVDIGREIEVGMKLQAENEQGMYVVTVTEVDSESITIDGNHDLAGVTLNFDVEIMDIRDASSEELAHGHVHGPDGHHHH